MLKKRCKGWVFTNAERSLILLSVLLERRIYASLLMCADVVIVCVCVCVCERDREMEAKQGKGKKCS